MQFFTAILCSQGETQLELGTIVFLTPEPLGFEALCALSQMWDLAGSRCWWHWEVIYSQVLPGHLENITQSQGLGEPSGCCPRWPCGGLG